MTLTVSHSTGADASFSASGKTAWEADHTVSGTVDGVVPIGGIILWSGTIATIPATWALCDGTANSPGPDLRDRFIVGATSDSGGVAKTNLTGSLTQSGGNITPVVADHTLTTDVAVADHASHTHSVTSNVSGTVTPAGTIGWPVGVPAFTGSAWSAPVISWPVGVPTFAGSAWAAPAIAWPAGVPTFSGSALGATTFAIPTGTGSFKGTSAGGFSTVGGAAPGSTGATTSKSPGTPAGTIAWPAGVPTNGAYTPGGTVAWPAGVPTIATYTPTGTIGWPGGVPTFTGSTNQSITVTNNAVTSAGPNATLTHSVTQPVVSAHSVSPSPQPYFALAFIQRMS